MSKEKVYYWSDVVNWVDVCFSCTGQNIIEVDLKRFRKSARHFSTKDYDPNVNYLMCADCESVDVGTIPPEEVI